MDNFIWEAVQGENIAIALTEYMHIHMRYL